MLIVAPRMQSPPLARFVKVVKTLGTALVSYGTRGIVGRSAKVNDRVVQ